MLAASYDALKAVDPTITVIGVGLSPRGNDRPFAKSNASTLAGPLPARPRRRLPGERPRPADHGRARASTRTRSRSSGPLERRLRAGRTPGLANLDRIKQAVWDAFHGTAQPTFVETGKTFSRPLRLDLDEVGWQVEIPPGLAPLYHGAETPGLKLV